MPRNGTEPTRQRLHRGDRSISVTFGPKWGGVWTYGHRNCWRLSLGWVAFTFYKGDFNDLLKAWLDRG